jgi:virulence factor Mce-like protein
VAVAIALFNGSFTPADSVTVLTDRAGLLMGRGAKVKWHGAQIGTVSAIRQTSDGRAELTLAIDPKRMDIIPGNTLVEIGPNTVFGAKSVEFLSPPTPSATRLRSGQVLDSEHVTVEVNTIFDDLHSVLTTIDPAKLNETLGAISTAFGGRGEKFGQSMSDFNAFLGRLEPSLPTLDRELQAFPDVANAFADAAPDLVSILRNSTRISQTLVDTHSDLDRLLVASIGLADTGNEVIGGNRESLTNLMRVLVPTTDLTNRYHEALNCALTGMISFALKPPNPLPGVVDLAALSLGQERYRYPQDLPKVAATGGPQCKGQLPIRYNDFPPKIVADVGADPSRYGNQGILLNSDALKQWLFGPVDGPPRNVLQWGQPG